MSYFFQYIFSNLISLIGLIVVLIRWFLNRTVIKTNVMFAGTYDTIVQGFPYKKIIQDMPDNMMLYDLEIINFTDRNIGIRFIHIGDDNIDHMADRDKKDYLQNSEDKSTPMYVYNSKMKHYHPFNAPGSSGHLVGENQNSLFTVLVPKNMKNPYLLIALVHIPLFLPQKINSFPHKIYRINWKRKPYTIKRFL
ncbi:hypothetical protein [Lactobacillus terrae]|uniref:hypothetical protein n=1 Tax=Lactobacillus terrae TaxID=2269374 RepID=UPI000C1B7866|nr:hypothetical protein [Lactobacillus terrae]